MIKGLIRRSDKAGLSDRIDARVCRPDSLGLTDISGKIDFVLAFALIHEVPDKERLLYEIFNTIKQNGKLLIAEPRGHISKKEFDTTVSTAQKAGFDVVSDLLIRRSYAILLINRQD